MSRGDQESSFVAVAQSGDTPHPEGAANGRSGLIRGYLETDTRRTRVAWSREPRAGGRVPVLIVPNSYGLLPYVFELAEALEQTRPVRCFAMSFSGVDGSSGVCSLSSGTDDVEFVLDGLRRRFEVATEDLVIVAHCTGLFPVLELSIRRTLNVRRLLAYNFIRSPARLAATTMFTMSRLDIRFDSNPMPMDYDSLQRLDGVNCPFTVVHPRLKGNWQRATQGDLDLLMRKKPDVEILRPALGYDTVPGSQRREVQRLVEFVLAPLLVKEPS